jgi:hypothetical protein
VRSKGCAGDAEFLEVVEQELRSSEAKIGGDDWDGSKLTKYDRCIEPKARKPYGRKPEPVGLAPKFDTKKGD